MRHRLRKLTPEQNAERWVAVYQLRKLEQDRRDFDMEGPGRAMEARAFRPHGQEVYHDASTFDPRFYVRLPEDVVPDEEDKRIAREIRARVMARRAR